MRRGGGVGYDFSHIRPRGAHVRGTDSRASGPLSYMRVFDQSCETVESAGSRRGAQMGILRCDHPDIEAFIHAKDDGSAHQLQPLGGRHRCVRRGRARRRARGISCTRRRRRPISSRPARVSATTACGCIASVRARALWDEIMRSTYDHAEPGVVFIDAMNRDNNLSYCETIEACNPCGEQPLPPYGCCDLGSIDLTRFVRDPFTPRRASTSTAFAAT